MIHPLQTLELRTKHFIRLKQEIVTFHHEETPRQSLRHVFADLQRRRIRGCVRRIDQKTGSLGVQFPRMRQLLWVKPYEVVRLF